MSSVKSYTTEKGAMLWRSTNSKNPCLSVNLPKESQKRDCVLAVSTKEGLGGTKNM